MSDTMFFSLLLNIGLVVFIATLLTKIPIVNTRVIGVLAAGLLGGPWAGNSMAVKMQGFEQNILPVGREKVKHLRQLIGI